MLRRQLAGDDPLPFPPIEVGLRNGLSGALPMRSTNTYFELRSAQDSTMPCTVCSGLRRCHPSFELNQLGASQTQGSGCSRVAFLIGFLLDFRPEGWSIETELLQGYFPSSFPPRLKFSGVSGKELSFSLSLNAVKVKCGLKLENVNNS